MRIEPPPSLACAAGDQPRRDPRRLTRRSNRPASAPGPTGCGWARRPWAPSSGGCRARGCRPAQDHEPGGVVASDERGVDGRASPPAPARSRRSCSGRPPSGPTGPSRGTGRRGTARPAARPRPPHRRAWSNVSVTTAFRVGLPASIRSIAASTSSAGVASPACTSAAWAVASSQRVSSAIELTAADVSHAPAARPQVRAWAMATFTTACPLDCPDTCSLAVTVEHGRLTAVDAAPGNPLTAGYICHKLKHHARRVYGPERIMTPLVRTGPKGPTPSGRRRGTRRSSRWRPGSAPRSRRRGRPRCCPTSTARRPRCWPRRRSPRCCSLGLGVPEVAHTICAATAGRAWDDTFGDMLSTDPLDVPTSRLVVVWGANPTVSNTHLLPLLTEAKGNGARVVVIDPRRTGVAPPRRSAPRRASGHRRRARLRRRSPWSRRAGRGGQAVLR